MLSGTYPRYEAGAQKRGLPRTGGAEDGKKTCGPHPGNEVVGKLFPAKEISGILDLERTKPDIRAPTVCSHAVRPARR